MKFVCAVIVAMAPLVAADKPAEKPAAKPAARSQAAASAKAAPKTQEIPVGAVKAADGTWRYTMARRQQPPRPSLPNPGRPLRAPIAAMPK
jgi:hypothetical protein